MIVSNIGELKPGSVSIKVLTSNEINVTLKTDPKFKGKVIQPGGKSMFLTGEHGLALLIKISNDKGETQTILFDTGGFKNTISNNCEFLKEEFSQVDKVIISHGHYDHTGSLLNIIPKLKSGCEIFLNPLCFAQNHLIRLKGNESIPWKNFSKNLEKLQEQNKVVLYAKLPILDKKKLYELAQTHNIKIIELEGPYKLTQGAITSGEIEIIDPDEVTKGFYLVNEELDETISHTFRDETTLYINVKDKGLIIISGCGHTGILNTIQHGQNITGINKIYSVIGGFHEDWSTEERIIKTCETFRNLNPEIVCGMHCTGFRFNARMMAAVYHTLGVAGTEFFL